MKFGSQQDVNILQLGFIILHQFRVISLSRKQEENLGKTCSQGNCYGFNLKIKILDLSIFVCKTRFQAQKEKKRCKIPYPKMAAI